MKRTHFIDKGFLAAIKGKPREYRIKSGVATQEIETLFDQADDLLNNRLDNLMKIFVNRDPNFYNGYEKARMIGVIRNRFYPPPGDDSVGVVFEKGKMDK